MIEEGRPIICATSMARLRPGMPAIIRYVGCAVAASNSIDALTMRVSLTAKLFSAEKMRRHDHQRAGIEEMLDDRGGNGGAFLRIRARSELVEQHERAVGGAFEDAPQPDQIGGEGREVFEDALVVADEDVEVVDDPG